MTNTRDQSAIDRSSLINGLSIVQSISAVCCCFPLTQAILTFLLFSGQIGACSLLLLGALRLCLGLPLWLLDGLHGAWVSLLPEVVATHSGIMRPPCCCSWTSL